MSEEQASEDVTRNLKTLAQGAEELMDATAGQAGQRLSEIRSRLAAALESAKETCENLGEKTAAAANATDRTIREHPYESIGVAFGVGLLIGVLVARR